MTGKARDLDSEFTEFTEARRRVKCITCQLPDDVRNWAEAKVEGGASMLAVSEFLTKKGHRVGVGALKGHILNHAD